MSFKQNSMINPGNYEEYFILYMDNELSAEQKLMVEAFIARHPALAEELEVLMNTKLSPDEVNFAGKEELFSSSMKVATVDEALLLYIDNELPASEKKGIEEKITSDKDYALQHAVLMQTKLDAGEKISHPNKKELYRYTERVIVFKGWMRIAAAVILLLFGSLFFLLNKTDKPVTDVVIVNQPKKQLPAGKQESSPVKNVTPPTNGIKEETVLTKSPVNKLQQNRVKAVASPLKDEKQISTSDVVSNKNETMQKQREVIKFDVNRFTKDNKIDDATLVNTNITYSSVTSALPDRTTKEDAQEPADPSGDFKNIKKSSAKGLFRKVTRFIGRNTGIGTADIGEEVLIGAVALKLK